MTYINAGVTINGLPVKTKKELKRLVLDAPAKVRFYGTGLDSQGAFGLQAIDEHTKVSVCGPDPYKNRVWYATVEWTGIRWSVT